MTTSNLDEQKVKDLLLKVVAYVDRMSSPNGYRWTLTQSIISEIEKAVLTTPEPCATVKKTLTTGEAREFTGRAPGVPENPGYQ